MKAPVSLDYVVVVTLLAGASAVLYTSPSPAFNLTALLLGVYALHLVSLRVSLRTFLSGAYATKHLKGKHLAEIQDLREELENDRHELDNRKAELEQRINAAEQQWELLRQMIRDRVEGGQEVPSAVATEPQDAWASPPIPTPDKANGGTKDTPRIHGRW